MEKIQKLLSARVADVYQGETRDWWNDVDEEAIYKTLGDPAFEAFVNRVIEDSVSGDFRKAV